MTLCGVALILRTKRGLGLSTTMKIDTCNMKQTGSNKIVKDNYPFCHGRHPHLNNHLFIAASSSRMSGLVLCHCAHYSQLY